MKYPMIQCVDFRTSSHSAGNGECVEVGSSSQCCVVVRDSKDAGGFWMAVSRVGWREFVGKVKQAASDLCSRAGDPEARPDGSGFSRRSRASPSPSRPAGPSRYHDWRDRAGRGPNR